MSEIPKGLVERVEAATEGSRELDREIVTALYGEPIYDAEQPWGTYWNNDGCDVEEDDIPSYTTSIDAAMTLVPEGARLVVDSDGCHCRITKPDDEGWPSDGYTGFAGTMALAIVAASLRAKSLGGAE